MFNFAIRNDSLTYLKLIAYEKIVYTAYNVASAVCHGEGSNRGETCW